MSKDMVNSLVEEVEHLKAKVVELEKEPEQRALLTILKMILNQKKQI